MLKFPSLHRIIRYGIVGLLSNLFSYLIYLLLTLYWLDPKIAITILYPLGFITSYYGHSKYSFSYQERSINATLRYVLAYLIGYGANFMLLLVLSDQLKFPHQTVQALAIFIVSGVMFIMLNYFVFPHSKAISD